MTFQPCSEFKGYFYHIDSLSQALSLEAGSFDDCDDAYTTGGATYQLCSKTVDISLSAGDEIGTVDGTFDFGAYDSRIDALDYANPDRFWTAEDGFDKLHLVCAIDYFSSGVKGALEALLGGKTPGGGPFAYRTAAPLCGEVEQDAAGTAQGIWFVEGTTGTFQQEDAHLALIHNNVDPTIPEFSVGTSFSNWDSGTYVFSIQNSGLKNRDFDDVTADGNAYCYESISYASGGTAISSMMIVLQMTGATTLRIERQSSSSCGDGPWTFGSNYVDFER
jgi:hypothetical protein